MGGWGVSASLENLQHYLYSESRDETSKLRSQKVEDRRNQSLQTLTDNNKAY